MNQSEKQRLLEHYNKVFYSYLRYISIPICVFSLIILFDYYSSPKKLKEELISTSEVRSRSFGRSSGIRVSKPIIYLHTKNFAFPISESFNYFYDYKPSSSLFIEITPLFKIPKTVGFMDKKELMIFEIPYTIYSSSNVFPILMLLSSCLTIGFWRNYKVGMYFGMAAIIIFIVAVFKVL